MKSLIVCLAALPLAGCSVFSEKVGPQLAKVANKYCEQPYDARMLLRNEVNAAIAPNQAKVWCNGDPDPKPFP